MGIGGLVCGFLGLFFCWVPFFGGVLPVGGIIAGLIGLASGKNKAEKVSGGLGVLFGTIGLLVCMYFTLLDC